ncbi:MAG: sigma 54-interacting transcriptional regulator [Terracidiphilus sp.]|jgi:DNA-binding NtrC family response regulator
MASTATIQNAKRQAKPTLPIEARIQRAITRIAESECPVLILGEHGVGKRTIAMQIHARSNPGRGAFKEICCGDTNAQALRSALSFDGTIYLAEITDLSLSLQELVVNAYFRAEETPTGRLLCGSSRELLEEVKSWRMREDFYHLVSAVTLRIPPLRCRKPEILSIADELLTRYAKQFDRPKPVLGKEIIGHLMEHTWPDNLSELQTAIKTFVAIGDQAISLAAIKAAHPGNGNGSRRHLFLKEATRASSIQIERQLISEVLASTGGNRKRAAADLGISYKALLYKLKQIETENQSLLNKNGVVQ